MTDPRAPQPRRRSTWLSPGRIAATGALLLLVALIVLWVAPADGYQLDLVDRAHPVAPLVHIAGKRPRPADGTIYFVDVRERQARLIERLVGWTRPDGVRSGRKRSVRLSGSAGGRSVCGSTGIMSARGVPL